MSQTDTIKTLQRQIAEGLQPVCPICGSGLKIEKQEGATGAYGYNYHCTRENDPECTLLPATVYTSWSRRIEHALKSKVVAVAVAVIGSISLTLGAGSSLGWINFNKENTQVTEGSNSGMDPGELPPKVNPVDTAELSEVRKEKVQLEQRIAALRDSLRQAGLRMDQAQMISMGKVWRALYIAPDSFKTEFLWDALEMLEQDSDLLKVISPRDQNELTEQLAKKVFRGELQEADAIDRAIQYTEKYGLSIRKNQNLGIAHFHLADKRDFWKNKLSSMAFFLDYLQDIRNRNPEKLAAEKNTILRSIRSIFQFALDSQKLPPGWQNLTFPDLEALIDQDPTKELPARTDQLRSYAADL